MSSDHPTAPDNAKPFELSEEEPMEAAAPEVESWTDVPATKVDREPTLRDIMQAINALGEEVRGAIGQIGETYGKRLDDLEAWMNKKRLSEANGSTRLEY